MGAISQLNMAMLLNIAMCVCVCVCFFVPNTGHF